jgi:hypothetical protein
MRELIQSTAANVMAFMVLSSDSKTGATGKTLTITASKDGGAFNSISPTVTERGSGWYNIALTTSHTDTLGDLALHITEADCDPSDFKMLVVSGDLTATMKSSVNAEVLDVLVTDTFAELSAPPAATSSLKNKITWLFMWARNRATQSTTERKLYADDATTVVSTEAVSDDGTTYDKGEAA